MSNNEGISKLTKALAEVSAAVGSLQPDARNTQQNYNYISADKILERVGKELPKYGLAIIPSIVDDSCEYIEYKDGKTRIDGRVRFVMYVCHESGEQINAPWTGYGSDYAVPDKAIYKAITSGHKYFLMKLFNVGVGNEDGEHDSYDESTGASYQPTPKPPKKMAAPPPTNGKASGIKPPPPTEEMKKQFHALGTSIYGDEWDDKRPELVKAISNKRLDGPTVTSSNELNMVEMQNLIDGMKAKAESEAALKDALEAEYKDGLGAE